MKLFGRDLHGFAEVLVWLVAVLLVASGMCGLQAALSGSGGLNTEGVLIPLGIAELLAMGVSAAGIVVVLLLWLGSALYARFAKKPRDPAGALFGDWSDKDKPG